MAIGIGDQGEEHAFLRTKTSAKFNIDMTKPIVAQCAGLISLNIILHLIIRTTCKLARKLDVTQNQVGYLGADYDEWVHQPVLRKEESPKFFENDLLERITRTKWWMIPAVWGPVFVWNLAKAMAEGHLSPTSAFGLTVFGVLLWTLVEYIMHRFLFHMKTSSYRMNTIHFVIHGFHHKYPMDADRLVFPPLYTLVIDNMFVTPTMRFLLPSTAFRAVWGGALLGYIMYDLGHYFLHFGTPFTDYLFKLKKEHSNHHFKFQMHNYGFGVTSSFWDKIFGTMPPSKIQARLQAVAPMSN